MFFEENVPNEQLRRVRHLKGWTQSGLAELLGTDFETVSRWERGITAPSAYFRERLCTVLEKTPEELGLLADHNDMLPPSTSAGVFLAASYADSGREVVTDLRAHLQARGVTVFSPRTLRRHEAENQRTAWQEAIHTAQAVLLIVSPEARASRHVQKALQLAGIYKRPLCSIWIEGESWQECVPPDCGKLFATIDARENNDHSVLDEIIAKLDEIMAKLEEVRLASNGTAVSLTTANKSTELPLEPRNPYKGLKAFHNEDRHDFFGRDALVGELTAALNAFLVTDEAHIRRARLLAVVGPSGSGKSSVVMAGLLPRLQVGELPGSQEWVYLDPILPGVHPIESLAISLARQLPDRSLKTIRDDLEDDAACGLHLLASYLRTSPETRVVLFIDQFEEVFTQTISEDERQHFIALLVTAVTELRGPTILILTLRADFYDRPLHYIELCKLIESNQRLVPPMDLKELREVIEKPAELPDVQLTFEGDLVSDLLLEVQEEVGALPLLQFTLDQLFQRRSKHQMTLTAYGEIGGVKGAVARHAEATYASLPSEEHRKLTRVLFLRLIEPGATIQETTRRRIPRSELLLSDPKGTVIIDEVTRAFTAARLLTTNTVSGEATVEVSHEAVIREWARLSNWLDEAREDVYRQQTISEDATEWARYGRSRDRLYRGTQLKEAQAWERRNTPSRSEATFLLASAAHQRRSRVGMAAILLLLVLFIGLLTRPFVLLGIAEMRFAIAPTIVTSLSDTGPGSLRQAIALAPVGSTITFEAGLRGNIVLANILDIAKSLTIRGPGAGVLSIDSGKTISRVNVHAGTSVTISGLTFQNSTDSGIFNEGTLMLINSVVSHNTASSLYSVGGGIYNDEGSLTLINSVIANNTSSGSFGAIAGGVMNNSSTKASTLTITDSTVSGNVASSSSGSAGGGIYNGDYDATLTLTGSIVSDNEAIEGNGGGIADGDEHGTTTLTNSTISGNKAIDYIGGGGIYALGSQDSIVFCTIYGNSATNTGGGGIWTGKNPYSQKPAQVQIRNSIVALNRAGTGQNILGSLISDGYNLIQNGSGMVLTLNKGDRLVHDLSHVFAGGTQLHNNGGPTQTLALLSDPQNPALNVIPLSSCQIKEIYDTHSHRYTDQRGMQRPEGKKTACDIGAYES